MDENKKIELQNKLINIIYHDIDSYGSIKDTYEKARMIDPTIEYDTVKKWYAKNLLKKDNYKCYNSFIASNPKQEYQVDVMQMNDRRDYEDSDKVALIGVDIFTKQIEIVKL